MTTRFEKTAAILTSGLLALTLSACSAYDDTSEEPPPPEQFDAYENDDTQGEQDNFGQETDEHEDPTFPDDSGTGGATGELTEVDIGETIEDPATGDTIEIVSAVRNFDADQQNELLDKAGEAVLVEITVQTGTESDASISHDNFTLAAANEDEFIDDETAAIEEQMVQAGYEPLEVLGLGDAEFTGWVGFLVEDQADSYVLEFSRSGEAANGGEQFVKEVEIPAS